MPIRSIFFKKIFRFFGTVKKIGETKFALAFEANYKTICCVKHLLVRFVVSLNRPLGRFSHRVAMSVCGGVCDVAKHPLPGAGETCGQRT